jgi:endonuclease/exonuclease/phosphatase (EEP) superfamily protein YafD
VAAPSPKLGISGVGWAGILLGGVAAAAGLLAQAGPWLPRLDLLAQLAPLILVVAATAVLLSLFDRRVRTLGTGLGAIGLLASGGLVAPEYLRSTGPAGTAHAPGEIKVIQFNVWRGNPEFGRVVDWLASEHPDFVLIEESDSRMRDLIVARTGWRVAGAKTTAMIFSRAPYLVMHRPTLADTQGFTWVNATYATASGPVEIVVTHFMRPTQTPAQTQIRGMTGVLAHLPRDRMILGGDFNTTPWSAALRAGDRGFGLLRRDRALATWPGDALADRPLRFPAPFMPIDHVYAGPGWATVSVRRGPRLGSDHYPLVVTLAPTQPAKP